jgi:ATP-binding cassette subfamily B protein
VFSQARAAVIISHRVGLCRLADRIVVMRNGRVIESGKHDTLISINSAYAKMWAAQEKLYFAERRNK